MLRSHAAIAPSMFAILATLIATPVAEAQRGRMGSPTQNGWLGDYRSGKEEARKTGKPLMVVIRCVP